LGNDVSKARFPTPYGFTHIGQVVVAVVNLGDRADHGVSLVGDAPKLVVEETLDDMWLHTKLCEPRAKGAANIMERPTYDPAPLVKFSLCLLEAVESSRRFASDVIAAGGEEVIGIVPSRGALNNARRDLAIGKGVLCLIFSNPLGERDCLIGFSNPRPLKRGDFSSSLTSADEKSDDAREIVSAIERGAQNLEISMSERTRLRESRFVGAMPSHGLCGM
jgi:hypothetical protein